MEACKLAEQRFLARPAKLHVRQLAHSKLPPCAPFLVRCRYVEKRFLARPAGAAASQQALQEWLWEAAQRGDVRGGKFPH